MDLEAILVRLIGSFLIGGGVLHFLDKYFEGFLDKKNLECLRDQEKAFRDAKYDLRFMHDIKDNLESDYDEIYNKYMRRIDVFRKKVQSGMRICYIRSVWNVEELSYIVENEEYIDSIIKKGNTDNEILFLIPVYMEIPEKFKYVFFKLNITCYDGGNREKLRGLFESNHEIESYCIERFDEGKRRKNILFDMQKERR